MTNDGFHTYKYDADGNILTVGAGQTATYVYDALNHRVYSSTASGANEYVYDYAGRQISTWNTATNDAIKGRIYWDGRQIAYRASDGTTYFDHQDYLGTEKIRTNYQGAVAASYKSLPWGDNYSSDIIDASGGQDSLSFAGLDFDAESNTQHAQFRNYSTTQGRWLVPDPYDGSYDITNPQSFNRYAYVLNNPLGFTDPLGLNLVLQCDENGENCVETDDGNGPGDAGGSDCNVAWEDACAIADGAGPGTWPCQVYGYCGSSTSNNSNIPAVAPNSNSYMYIQGIGMVGPSPKPGCDQIARATQAAIHAAATSVQNTKGNVAKLMASLKAAAPTIGVYGEAGTSFLGFSEAVAAPAGAYLSGGAEAVGSLAAVYAVGTGVLDFYDQMTGPANSCPVVP